MPTYQGLIDTPTLNVYKRWWSFLSVFDDF